MIEDLEGEEWRDVVGYEGHYIVSNLGRVSGVDRIVKSKGVNGRTCRGKIIKLRNDKDGYKIVGLCCYGISKGFRVHRLVAKVFIPNPENKPQVNHKNGIKYDNKVENLEWVTESENTIHSFSVLKRSSPTGSAGKFGALNVASKMVYQYSKEGELVGIYNGCEEATRRTGVHRSNISTCARGEIPYAGGYVWSYIKIAS